MYIFRMNSSLLVLISTTDVKAMELNTGHYSKEIFLATHTSYILPKGSPLMVCNWVIKGNLCMQCYICFVWPPQPSFQKAILWLKDTGILSKLKDDVMNPPTPIPLPKVRHNQPLILRQLGITMIILALGLFIATLVFLREITASKIRGGTSQHNADSNKCLRWWSS